MQALMNASKGQMQPQVLSRSLAVRQNLVAAVLFTTLELLCFAPIFKRVGFYLDDWITLNLLDFGPKSFLSACWQYLISDPRVVARPVEAFYYVVLYFMFGLKPLGYHVLNAGLEIGAAFFLYLAISRLTGRRALAAVAGLILIIYPNHDVTHYWATCSSENLSLLLVMASLYCTVVAAGSKSLAFHALSALAIALSLFCYETFLPLILLNVVFAYLACPGKSNRRAAIKQICLVVAPFLVFVISLLVYSRLVVPHIAAFWQVHPVSFDPGHMIGTIWEGIRINSPVYALPFFGQLASQAFLYESIRTLVTEVLIACLVLGCGIYWLAAGEEQPQQPVFLLPLGALTFIASYSIFGLNPEYTPTFQTILSRINEGAAVGIALMVSGAVALVLRFLQTGKRRQTALICCLFLLPIVSLSFLANRGYARAWELCWYTQTVIRDSLKGQENRFKAGDSVILANCPRYVMWSPLFDGVWDFQPMLQLALKNKAIKGGVVSERMVIAGNNLKDIAKGSICNTYEFGKSYLIIPPHGDIVPINSGQEFVDQIRQRGMKFGLDPAALGRWQTEVDNSKN